MRFLWRQDRGDVILSGLLHTAMFLVVVGLLVYEVGAFVVNSVQLDYIAGAAARSAAYTAAEGGRTASVEQAVLTSLAHESGIVLEGITADSDSATVSISRQPSFLITQRIPPLADYFTGHATKTARPSNPL